jgi:hypothetical protein
LLHEPKKPIGRTSVSAEAYGKYNPKGEFKPVIIQKSALQKARFTILFGFFNILGF